MTYPEMIMILAGAAIALSPVGIMLGANLMEEWQEQQKQKQEEEECK